jgi:hypothetical protein
VASIYQWGCGEASDWESVLLEAGTELSLNLSSVHTFQREAVGIDASAWESVILETGTELSVNLNVSGRLWWRSLSLGISSSGGWN